MNHLESMSSSSLSYYDDTTDGTDLLDTKRSNKKPRYAVCVPAECPGADVLGDETDAEDKAPSTMEKIGQKLEAGAKGYFLLFPFFLYIS